MNMNKAREEFLNEVIKSLEKNIIPWKKGWLNVFPKNFSTNKTYNGINSLILINKNYIKNYKDTRWLTFIQAKQKKLSIKKGEKGTTIEFFHFYDKNTKKPFDPKTIENKSRKEQTEYKAKYVVPQVKFYTVFNVEQLDGEIEPEIQEKKEVEYNKLDNIINKCGVKINYGGNRAFYNKNSDEITLPQKNFFYSENEFYATALHEIAHSTGHTSRLNRNLEGSFGSKEYAREELIAEFASYFISLSKNIIYTSENIDNTKAYLQSWIQLFKEKPEEFFKASAEANKVADYVLNYENI